MTELVRAGRRDIPRLAELWAHAFPGERTVEQRVRQLEAGGVYGGVDDAWYVEREGRLAGALRTYALTQYLHGSPLRMMGLAAVAVAADARRQGLAADMCRQALQAARARGDLVSVLYPFRPDFYHRLGWGLVGALHTCRFRPDALPASVRQPRVRLAQTADRPAIEECYARVAGGSHGLIQRGPRVWDQHLQAATRHAWVLPAGAGAAGYALVSYGRSRSAADRALLVHELVAEAEPAYRELLSWLALQQDQFAQVRYDALPEERLDLLLSEPRPPRFRPARTLWAPVARRIRGPMLRVLDVPAALQARRHWPAAAPCEFVLRVRDPELSENEGPWLVSFAGGLVTCRPVAASATLELDSPAFAQLYAGELNASEAVRLGRATSAGGLEEIDALFACRRTLRLLDEF